MADFTNRNADETKQFILTFDENGGSPEYTKIEDANGVDRTAEVVELLGINDKEDADPTILKEADVEDSLNSTSTTKPLSANQGKQLNDDKASLSMFEEGEHTVTLTPSTSGSITLRSDINTMYWERTGDRVHVQGMIQVDSVSSPEGAQIRMSLPFVIAEKTDASGRFGGSIVSGVDDLVAFITLDGESQIRIIKDASTQQTGLSGRYYFSFSYIKA